jgi:hypothetical protein
MRENFHNTVGKPLFASESAMSKEFRIIALSASMSLMMVLMKKQHTLKK